MMLMAAATAAISKLTMMGAWMGAGVSLGAGVCVMALLLLGRRPQGGADGAHGVVPLLMLLPLLLLLPAAPALGFTRHVRATFSSFILVALHLALIKLHI